MDGSCWMSQWSIATQLMVNEQYSCLSQIKWHWPFHSQEWSISNFPCSLTRDITSHSMKNLAFHSLLRWKVITLPILTTSLIHLSLKAFQRERVWRMSFLNLGVKGFNLRAIHSRFRLHGDSETRSRYDLWFLSSRHEFGLLNRLSLRQKPPARASSTCICK